MHKVLYTSVTRIFTQAAGDMTIYKNGAVTPAQPNLYWTAGETHAAMVVVPVDADGKIRIDNNSTGATDVIVDVQGYFVDAPDASPTVLKTVDPARVLATPTSSGVCSPNCGRLPGGSAKTVQIGGQGGIPMGAAAVSLTITAATPTGGGWLEAAPDGSFVQGAASVLNYDNGENVANAAILQLPANGKIVIWTSTAADVFIDVNGYFAAPVSTWNYTYDGDGLRRTKSQGFIGATYRYNLAEGLAQPIAESIAGILHRYTIYGPGGLPIEQIGWDGTKVWFHHDQLGSTRLLTDEAGNWRTKYSYDPYGNPGGVDHNPSFATVTTNHQYAGQVTDPEPGYQYLRARYYDPTTGRFLTRDPIEPLTRSAYGYAGASPTNNTDPSGLYWGEDLVNTGVGLVTRGAADCLDILDANCTSVAEANPAATQAAVDVSGGVLNGLSFGNAQAVIGDTVDWDSGWAAVGNWIGWGLTAPFAVGAAPIYGGLDAANAIGHIIYSCRDAASPDAWAACLDQSTPQLVNLAAGGFAAFFPGAGAAAWLLNSPAASAWLANLRMSAAGAAQC